MKRIIKEVFNAMEYDRVLSEDETQYGYRQLFYKNTSKPLDLSYSNTSVEIMRETKRALNQAIYNFVTEFAGHTKIQEEVEVEDFDPETKMGKFTIVLRPAYYFLLRDVRQGKLRCEFYTEEFTYTSKRAEKPIKCFNNVIDMFFNALANNLTKAHKNDDIKDYINIGAGYLTQYQNRYAKDLQNTLNALGEHKTLWLYFTNNNYAEHYTLLAENEDLTSCMSKPVGYFGNYDKEDNRVHPLEGYDYAPDFRLGLLSTKSPEELANIMDGDDDVDSYPFIARVVVFPSDNGELRYSRIYGNEKYSGIVRKFLTCEGKPYGARLYGIVCKRSASDELSKSDLPRLLALPADDKEAVDCYFVAPYVDTYANQYMIDGEVTTVDGREVIPLIVATSADFEDGDVYGIYYETGVLYKLDEDGERTDDALIMKNGVLRHYDTDYSEYTDWDD